MIQPPPAPATPFAERSRKVGGRHLLGLGLTLLIEGLLLLLLLTLGTRQPPGIEDAPATVVTFITPEAAEQAPAPRPEPEQKADERPAAQRPDPDQPPPPQPAEPAPAPVPTTIMPTPWQMPPSAGLRPARPAPAPAPSYGPPDIRSAAARDTERVGTAPNGEPLYAAAWYREPEDAMMRAYLSTARGPGWGLIACRTAPSYRVEDCVALEEYPAGSQINRSVLAMAWEFRVRPPRLGGRPLVGAWVRIRIDYGLN